MAEVKKTVRFYETRVYDENEQLVTISGEFWERLIAQMGRWDASRRRFPIGGVQFTGEAIQPRRPALPHVQVGRLRDLSEHLNRHNLQSGETLPLTFDDPDDRVAEPTFIVPFGQSNRVAIMSPATRGTRSETLARWVTGVCHLAPQGRSLRFVPIVDEGVLEKILESSGALMLDVSVQSGANIPDGGGAFGDAFRLASEQAVEDIRIRMRWSYGHASGSPSGREALRAGALWVAQTAFTTTAEVSILEEDEEGLVSRETHSIFNDRIAQSVAFHVPEGEIADDETILTSIGEAITDFVRAARA
ncbi:MULTISPECIES: hypothetical protein [unclassified Rathayibacter]|uniref:hypothetical protein n=1 Tax=unclassified Rathayibacter TaxID=2609250 RepID=UPI0011B0F3DE|nr:MULTISPECIES: hypothetical protein [unclassified Rathayibacter]